MSEPMPQWAQAECERLGASLVRVVQMDWDERGQSCEGVLVEIEGGRWRQINAPPDAQPWRRPPRPFPLLAKEEEAAPGFMGGTWFRARPGGRAHVSIGERHSLCGVAMAGAKLVDIRDDPNWRCANCLAHACKIGLTEARACGLTRWHARLNDFLEATGRHP